MVRYQLTAPFNKETSGPVTVPHSKSWDRSYSYGGLKDCPGQRELAERAGKIREIRYSREQAIVIESSQNRSMLVANELVKGAL